MTKYKSLIDHHEPGLMTSGPAYSVSVLFLFANVTLMVPSILIIIAVLGFSKMRTMGNLLVCQISILDILYATWSIGWNIVKLSSGNKAVNSATCSIEGSISALFMAVWLNAATSAAYCRYHSVIKGFELTRMKVFIMLCLQWSLPIALTTFVASVDRFDLTPSGGYCFLTFHKNDHLTYAVYIITIAVVLVPTVFAIYFYWAITRQYYIVSQRHISTMGYDKPPTTPRASGTLQAVAFRACLHSIIFLLSFLPLGVTMLAELIFGVRRTYLIDVLVIAAVLCHKILSPVVTLIISSSILNQVRTIVGLNSPL